MGVGGISDPREIANSFMNHFKVESILQRTDKEGLIGGALGDSIGIMAKDVRAVLRQMTRGKSPGHDGLSVEHLQNAGPHLPRVLTCFILFVSGTHIYLLS